MLKIKLHAFGAAKDRASCEDFLSGHQKVLKDYGIENITTNSESWFDNPNVYGVLAVDQQTGEIVGGIRVHKADGAHLLPVEEAVGDLDPAVHEIVERYTEDGVGELCALWNSRSVAKIGISTLLTRAGISIINQLDFRILMGICADYTLPMFTRVGFVVDNSLGDRGEFAYPNEEYVARVLGILDADSLDTAHNYDKARMLDLRNNPIQSVVEQGRRGEVDVRYDLEILAN